MCKDLLNKVYLGDSSKIMVDFPAEFVDLIVTSPPYDQLRTYNGFVFEHKTMIDAMFHVLKPGGVCVWVVNDQVLNGAKTGTSFEQALYFRDSGWTWHDTMIYGKSHSIYPAKLRYPAVFEYMFIFSKGSPKTFNPIKDRRNKGVGRELVQSVRNPDGSMTSKKAKKVIGEFGARHNIWTYEIGNNQDTKDPFSHKHPASFPESLAKDHILSWSNEGDVVLDPMSGSGTTAKMAKLLRRNYVAIDCSEEYVELIKQRLSATKVPMRLF